MLSVNSGLQEPSDHSNKSLSGAGPASLSSITDQIVAGLEASSTRFDVRLLVQTHGIDNVRAAWKRLDPLVKASLHLTKEFDGTIIHGRKSQFVSNEQGDSSRAEGDEQLALAAGSATRRDQD